MPRHLVSFVVRSRLVFYVCMRAVKCCAARILCAPSAFVCRSNSRRCLYSVSADKPVLVSKQPCNRSDVHFSMSLRKEFVSIVRFDFVAIWRREKFLKYNIRFILNSSEKCFLIKDFFFFFWKKKRKRKTSSNSVDYFRVSRQVWILTANVFWETNDQRKILKRKVKMMRK